MGTALLSLGTIAFAADDVSPVSGVKYRDMQAAVQKVLDKGVAKGYQSAAQCCVYIDGKLIVDAWAGTYTKDGTRKINGESLFPIFSTEKAMFVTAAHRLVEEGKLSYDMKIASVWPEFGCNGKEDITLRQVMSHTPGLPGGIGDGLTDEQQCQWDRMVKLAAECKTVRQPGSRSAYLSQSFSWFLGEPMQRVTGKKLRDIIIEYALKPTGTDRQIFYGTDAEAESRLVTVYNGTEKWNIERMNQPVMYRACRPAGNAVASARGLAKFYAHLIGMKGFDPILKKATLDIAFTPHRGTEDPVPDSETLNSKWQIVFGLGYGLWGQKSDIAQIVGQGGLGGSEGYADRKNQIVIGYTCATSATGAGESDLREDIYSIVGLRTRYMKDHRSTQSEKY